MKICLAFAVLLYVTKQTRAAAKENSYCGSSWTVHDGICYSGYNPYISLGDARYFCKAHHAKILKIESADQLKFIKNARKYPTKVWVDLYRRTEVQFPGWYWGDGKPFLPGFLKWNKGLESVYRSSSFVLTTQGTLVPFSRWRPNGYICEVKATDKDCPKDYKVSGKTCFFLSDLSNASSMSFSPQAASYLCRRKATGSKLLEIRSQTKMREVSKLITVKSSRGWWIGLKKSHDRWEWLSDSADASSVKVASYIKWANEPDNLGGKKNCAAMFLKTGRLIDMSCGTSTNALSICMKRNELPMFSPLTGKFGCGNKGWLRAGMSCYLLSEKLQTWDKSRADCQKVGGDLVEITSSIEQTWLMNILEFESSWTGLCYYNGAWRWTDGHVVDNQAIQWDAEPNEFGVDGVDGARCAVVNVRGEFIAQPCYKYYRYVCELREKDKSKCPQNWTYYNGSCYLVVANNRTTWHTARYLCRALADEGHRGYLFFPTYGREIDFVAKTLLQKIVQSEKKRDGPLYFWALVTDDNTGVWGYTYSRHYLYDFRHINWRKSPSAEAMKTNNSYCAMFSRGFLVDQPRNINLTSVCKRSLDAKSHTGETGEQRRSRGCLLDTRWWVLAACIVMTKRCAH